MAYRKSNRESCKKRVLLISMMLSKHRYISCNEIIRRLENTCGIKVDRKTIYNDINEINKVIPIEIKYGRFGGYRIMDFNWE